MVSPYLKESILHLYRKKKSVNAVLLSLFFILLNYIVNRYRATSCYELLTLNSLISEETLRLCSMTIYVTTKALQYFK